MKKTNPFSTKISRYTEALILILFGIFILSSCDKVVDYEKPSVENKLVIESYIMAGDKAVNVKVTKTLTPYEDDYSSSFDPRFYVTDAVVKLSFDNGEPFLLNLNNNDIHYPTTYSKKMKVPYADKCFLEVEHGTQKVYAEADFPSKTKINNASVILQKGINYNGAGLKYINIEININADFPTNETNYYRIQAYGEFVYNNGVSNNIFYLGSLSNDYLYFNTDGKNKNQNIRFSSYNDLNTLADKNKALIYLEHITPMHYQFRNAVKNQIETIGDEFNSEIVQIPTNIKGGLGIFTAITRDSIWADITIK